MIPPEPDLLVVCSIRRWVADDLRAGAGDRYRVLWDMGLDVPDVGGAETVAWWAPAEHAARLLRASVCLDLVAPGPAWLARVPEALTGRPVWAGRLADIADAPAEGWSKPAEAKVPGLPAAWRSTEELLAAAGAASFPLDGWVQVSPVHLELVEEHRAFVLVGMSDDGSVVVATSPYLRADGSTYELGWEDDPSFDHRGARSFAQDVVDEMARDQPAAYTLDVGKTATGRWVVVEANPAWCSGTYGADLQAAADCVVASSLTPSRDAPFAWAPDPYLLGFAERQPLLRRRAHVGAPDRS